VNDMENKQYPVIFVKEENGYSALLPDFNCATCGKDFKEALAMAKDCLTGQLQILQEDGETPPVPSEMDEQKFYKVCKEVEADPDAAFWCLVRPETCEPDPDLINWVAHSKYTNSEEFDGLDKEIDINEIDLDGWNEAINDVADIPPRGQEHVVRLLLMEHGTPRWYAAFGFFSEVWNVWVVTDPFNDFDRFYSSRVMFWRPM